jgi:hypothetical protein
MVGKKERERKRELIPPTMVGKKERERERAYPSNDGWADSVTKQMRYENLNSLRCGATRRYYRVLCE